MVELVLIYFFFFLIYVPLTCLRVPPGLLIPHVEYHWCRTKCVIIDYFQNIKIRLRC